jgi:hypothetical protein
VIRQKYPVHATKKGKEWLDEDTVEYLEFEGQTWQR